MKAVQSKLSHLNKLLTKDASLSSLNMKKMGDSVIIQS